MRVRTRRLAAATMLVVGTFGLTGCDLQCPPPVTNESGFIGLHLDSFTCTLAEKIGNQLGL